MDALILSFNNLKNKRIAFSCIDRITTSDNSIRIYCLDMNKTPDCEFSILIRK